MAMSYEEFWTVYPVVGSDDDNIEDQTMSEAVFSSSTYQNTDDRNQGSNALKVPEFNEGTNLSTM